MKKSVLDSSINWEFNQFERNAQDIGNGKDAEVHPEQGVGGL